MAGGGCTLVLGLNLEYTRKCWYKEQDLAVVQISMRKHVLMYHYCRSSKICPALKSFSESKRITFASMDKRRDRHVLARVHMLIPDEYHIDILGFFKIKGTGPDDRDGRAYYKKCA